MENLHDRSNERHGGLDVEASNNPDTEGKRAEESLKKLRK
jgi:hypothetical protein